MEEQQQDHEVEQQEEAVAPSRPFDPLDDATWPARPLETRKFG